MTPPPPSGRVHPPFSTPEAAQDAFYGAFAATDVTAMAEVWWDDPDILCIHPGGGLLKGTRAVMQSWAEIFAGAQPPTVDIEPVTGTTSGDIAVRVLIELIRANGKPSEAPTRVLATNIFRRVNGSWRLVQHHASLPLRTTPQPGDGDRRLH